TITNTELNNGTPWHIAFTGPPGFNGLSPFVYSNGLNGVIENGLGDDRIVTLGRGFTNQTFGGVQTNTVNFAGAYLPINFDSKTTVNVNGEGGDDTISVDVTTKAVGLVNLNVNGGGDTDSIDVKAVPAGVTTTADGGAGNDTVTRHATGADDTIDIVRGATTTVTLNLTTTLSVTAATTEALVIDAQVGDDAINVSGSGGPGNLVIQGGSPSASDTLNVITGASAAVNYGTDPASGVIADLTNGNVAFEGVEIINLTGAGGG